MFPFIIIHVPTIHIEHSFDKKAPVANSGVAGGACVIAVAAPATMNDPRVSRDREAPVEKQRKEEGRGERRQI